MSTCVPCVCRVCVCVLGWLDVQCKTLRKVLCTYIRSPDLTRDVRSYYYGSKIVVKQTDFSVSVLARSIEQNNKTLKNANKTNYGVQRKMAYDLRKMYVRKILNVVSFRASGFWLLDLTILRLT